MERIVLHVHHDDIDGKMGKLFEYIQIILSIYISPFAFERIGKYRISFRIKFPLIYKRLYLKKLSKFSPNVSLFVLLKLLGEIIQSFESYYVSLFELTFLWFIKLYLNKLSNISFSLSLHSYLERRIIVGKLLGEIIQIFRTSPFVSLICKIIFKRKGG